MPKLVTAQRQELEVEKAHQYIRTHILFPAGVLGLICVVSAAATLLYQFIVKTYSWQAFGEATGLLVIGALVGWGQTRYHRYLLREFPEHFALRMKAFERTTPHKTKKDVAAAVLDHPGRSLVPFLYLVGAGGLLGFSAMSTAAGHVDGVAAFLMPWAGFFWAKLFFWRRVLPEGKRQH